MSIRSEDVPDRFIRCFNFLASTKGGAVDDVKAESYYQTLGHLSIEAVEEAARQLCREPNAFLPSAGEWHQRAQAVSNSTWKLTSEKAALEITAPQNLPRDEVEEIRQARSDFLDAMEKIGYPLDRKAWEKRPIVVPRYGCAVCRDMGWEYHEKESAVSRCPCFDTNPVLEQRRALYADGKSSHIGSSGGASVGVGIRRGRSSP